jgi:hypothetical protein
MSAISPKIAGAIAATTRYDVTVRLIFETDTSKASESEVMAGKKMKDDRGENDAAKELKKMISHLRRLLKAEYGGGSVSVARISHPVDTIAVALPCVEIDNDVGSGAAASIFNSCITNVSIFREKCWLQT